jgi:hypothetical protein
VDYAAGRTRVVEWLRKQLIGPAFESETLHGISPLERYPTGVLFPVVQGEDGIDPASISEDESDNEHVGPGDEGEGASTAEPVVRRFRYTPPSSVGYSFFARGDVVRFEVKCTAASYAHAEREGGQFVSTQYERSELGGDAEAQTFEARKSQKYKRFNQRRAVLGERAGIDVLWRPFSGGWIVTVSFFNKQELDIKNGNIGLFSRERAEQSLFEVDLHCFLEEGEIGTYPRVDKSLLTEEEQELELQYGDRHIYAVGHGAAVDWAVEQDLVKEIWSDFLPAIEVPQVTADAGGEGNPVLGLAHLAEGKDEEGISDDVLDELDLFVADYSTWVSNQNKITAGLERDEQSASERICQGMDTALGRMKRGVSLLRTDSRAALSFRMANQAMQNQMRQSDIILGKNREEGDYAWRPFQLAFLLTVVESAINENDDFRDTVDLIWFPTGGGKTEAYLGLIAFLIVWRRLKYPAAGGGTTVIMRYTLRLLTTQQYLRATRMICALELIRRKHSTLGDEPITVGMWVGRAVSPNTFANAIESVQHAKDGRAGAQKRLVLDNCPWCETAFQAPESYISTETEFHFRCINPKCDFGEQEQGKLPCNVVDEALYDMPPTLLLATIDKFARLAWDERANTIFGEGTDRPPELIIQDELHLIAGALGSVAGLYEAALDTVLVQRGVHPKYIASTATIRMAKKQVERLYGKELAVFPPPGLSCDDSYFARTVPLDERPGRLYVGYLAPMLDRRHCLAPLAAALHVAPETVFGEGEAGRDELLEAWWTTVFYHGSLKDVGNSHNAFNIGIRDIVKRFEGEFKQIASDASGNEAAISDAIKINDPINRSIARIAQLTSISTAEENSRTFSRLELTRDNADCLDAVLATNMVSVGLDVSRLALMVVNGQPLTTAEYIQSSSRVGRSEVPGLVLTNYYRDQARSLSHYENFRPYHEAFYRFVEPTSVTPYTFQARTRALHAALVIAIRHSCKHLLGNDLANAFDPSTGEVQKVIKAFKRRCALADSERKNETSSHIDRLVQQWHSEVKHCQDQKIQLRYDVPDNDKAASRLLHNYDDRIEGLWPTLQSMRNVENTALLKPQ